MQKPDQQLPPQPCYVPITAVAGPRRREGQGVMQNNVRGRDATLKQAQGRQIMPL